MLRILASVAVASVLVAGAAALALPSARSDPVEDLLGLLGDDPAGNQTGNHSGNHSGNGTGLPPRNQTPPNGTIPPPPPPNGTGNQSHGNHSHGGHGHRNHTHGGHGHGNHTPPRPNQTPNGTGNATHHEVGPACYHNGDDGWIVRVGDVEYGGSEGCDPASAPGAPASAPATPRAAPGARRIA
ncbi:MAG TPA: hypothetical protein VHH36_07565 [Candidatus Thermoplasmatota archaeon]|nr:hypothetical protein [Candidatus Thermoplasmatota archaeon]